jgi:hypothetical protein
VEGYTEILFVPPTSLLADDNKYYIHGQWLPRPMPKASCTNTGSSGGSKTHP